MAAVANMNGGTSFTEEYVAASIQEYLKEVNKFMPVTYMIAKHRVANISEEQFYTFNMKMLGTKYEDVTCNKLGVNKNKIIHEEACRALGYTGGSEDFVGKSMKDIMITLANTQGTVIANMVAINREVAKEKMKAQAVGKVLDTVAIDKLKKKLKRIIKNNNEKNNNEKNNNTKKVIKKLEFDIAVQVPSINKNVIIIECNSKLHIMNSVYTDELKRLYCEKRNIKLIAFDNMPRSFKVKYIKPDRFEVGAEKAKYYNDKKNDVEFNKAFNADGTLIRNYLNNAIIKSNDMVRLINAVDVLMHYIFVNINHNENLKLKLDEQLINYMYKTSCVRDNWLKALDISTKKLSGSSMIASVPEMSNEFIKLLPIVPADKNSIDYDDELKAYNKEIDDYNKYVAAMTGVVDATTPSIQAVRVNAEKNLTFISNKEKAEQMSNTPLFTSSRKALFRCHNCGFINLTSIASKSKGCKCNKCKSDTFVANSKKEFLLNMQMKSAI